MEGMAAGRCHAGTKLSQADRALVARLVVGDDGELWLEAGRKFGRGRQYDGRDRRQRSQVPGGGARAGQMVVMAAREWRAALLRRRLLRGGGLAGQRVRALLLLLLVLRRDVGVVRLGDPRGVGCRWVCGLDWRIILWLRDIDRLFFRQMSESDAIFSPSAPGGAARIGIGTAIRGGEGAVRPPRWASARSFAMFASSNISIRRASLLRIPRRHLADDSSNYYGPGGLSARQIMDAVQKSRLKEAAAASIAPSQACHRIIDFCGSHRFKLKNSRQKNCGAYWSPTPLTYPIVLSDLIWWRVRELTCSSDDTNVFIQT